jgi:hypothetical protein
MAEYLIFPIENDKVVAEASVLTAYNDQDAIEKSEQLARHNVEVWQGTRLVRRIKSGIPFGNLAALRRSW